MLEFRKMTKDDVQAKAEIKPNGVLVLLYKNARADMAILDDSVGPFNWQRIHEGPYCKVSIKNPETGEWIAKEDVGYCESSDPEMQKKGAASDAFKRACSCWGIGRELYTAPLIWFSATELKGFDPKTCTDRDYFTVDDITYDGDRIASVKISVRCKGAGTYLTKSFGGSTGKATPIPKTEKPSEKASDAKPKEKISLPFPDDTIILIEELKGKKLGEVKNTKAFLRFLQWTTTRDVEYSTDEENTQFKQFKEVALSIFKKSA